MTPELHVYIPTIQRSFAALERCLDGIANQTIGRESFRLTIVLSGGGEFEDEGKVRELLPQAGFLTVPQLGVTSARMAALKHITAPLICSVDDDNVLSHDYLQVACQFLEQHSEVGFVGGKILPEFEVQPGPEVLFNGEVLALRDYGDRAFVSTGARRGINAMPGGSPVTAGMVCRREAVDGFVELLAQGKPLAEPRYGCEIQPGCEDAELVYYGVRRGYEIGYEPRMVLTHLIPARRMEKKSFRRAAYIGGVGWGRFKVMHGLVPPVEPWTVLPRKVKWFWTKKAWEPSGYVDWLRACGEIDGRASH
jgi:hypothetical protein